MVSALIVCKSGVMYSGELLEEYNDDLKWIGIKPSTVSDICLFFFAERIKKIYFQDGTSVTKIKSDLRDQTELDLDIPDENILLIRVRGGVSYRGQRLDQVTNEIQWKDGYWISPSTIQETIIYIPEHEVEKVYSM